MSRADKKKAKCYADHRELYFISVANKKYAPPRVLEALAQWKDIGEPTHYIVISQNRLCLLYADTSEEQKKKFIVEDRAYSDGEYSVFYTDLPLERLTSSVQESELFG